MSNVTKVLSDEHINILKVIGALQREISEISKGKKIDKEFFKEGVDFIRNYADRFHHAKEEDILFKALCMPEVEMHCNPVDQMLFEHDTGRDYIKGVEEGVEKNDKKQVIENVKGYAGLLTEHIYKEDNILYPMAEEALDEKTKKRILSDYKKAEERRFAKGVKEKYINVANRFELRN